MILRETEYNVELSGKVEKQNRISDNESVIRSFLFNDRLYYSLFINSMSTS